MLYSSSKSSGRKKPDHTHFLMAKLNATRTRRVLGGSSGSGGRRGTRTRGLPTDFVGTITPPPRLCIPAEPPKVPRRPPSKGNKRETLSDIARRIPIQVMRAYFNYPLRTAAQAMNISVTTLKRLCRRQGVKRWPHRQICGINRALSDLEAQHQVASAIEASAVAKQLRELHRRRNVIIELAFETGEDSVRTRFGVEGDLSAGAPGTATHKRTNIQHGGASNSNITSSSARRTAVGATAAAIQGAAKSTVPCSPGTVESVVTTSPSSDDNEHNKHGLAWWYPTAVEDIECAIVGANGEASGVHAAPSALSSEAGDEDSSAEEAAGGGSSGNGGTIGGDGITVFEPRVSSSEEVTVCGSRRERIFNPLLSDLELLSGSSCERGRDGRLISGSSVGGASVSTTTAPPTEGAPSPTQAVPLRDDDHDDMNDGHDDEFSLLMEGCSEAARQSINIIEQHMTELAAEGDLLFGPCDISDDVTTDSVDPGCSSAVGGANDDIAGVFKDNINNSSSSSNDNNNNSINEIDNGNSTVNQKSSAWAYHLFGLPIPPVLLSQDSMSSSLSTETASSSSTSDESAACAADAVMPTADFSMPDADGSVGCGAGVGGDGSSFCVSTLPWAGATSGWGTWGPSPSVN